MLLRHCRRPHCKYQNGITATPLRRPQYNCNSVFFVTMSAQSMFVLVGEARPHLHAGNHGVYRTYRRAEIVDGRLAMMLIIDRAFRTAHLHAGNHGVHRTHRRAWIANGRLVMMLITDRLFQNGASPCWHPWHTSRASACSDPQRQIVNEVDHRQILSEQRPAKIAEDRLARMRIIDMCFQRRMVRLVATMSYITRDVRAEIANGRLAMLQIIERFLRVNSGAKIAKDRLATMAFIRMFFQRRRVRLPATMGYITRDVRAEIANDRLATMDVIGIKFCDSWYGRSRTDSGIQPGSHVDGDGRVASTHEDAEARPHLHAGHVLHHAREARHHGLHHAGDHGDLQASQHRGAEARRHLLEVGGKGRRVQHFLRAFG